MITLHTFGPAFGLPDPSPFATKGLVLLKMIGLPFKTEAGSGALRKAPKGKLPFINDDGKIVADTTFIRFHLEDKYSIDLDAGLTPEQRATGWALEKMCEDHLYWAMVDSRWMVPENFEKGPRHYFDAAPALLQPLIRAKVRRDIKRNLRGHGFGRHTRAEIEQLAKRDYDAISTQLSDKPFLFGDKPHAADAAVWPYAIGCVTKFFESPINEYVRTKSNLVAYAARGLKLWFPELAKG